MALPLALEFGPLEFAIPGPWPAGGPPPWPRWARAGRLNASDIVVKAVIRTKCLCFTDSSCDLQTCIPAQDWEWAPGLSGDSTTVFLGCLASGKRCKPLFMTNACG